MTNILLPAFLVTTNFNILYTLTTNSVVRLVTTYPQRPCSTYDVIIRLVSHAGQGIVEFNLHYLYKTLSLSVASPQVEINNNKFLLKIILNGPWSIT